MPSPPEQMKKKAAERPRSTSQARSMTSQDVSVIRQQQSNKDRERMHQLQAVTGRIAAVAPSRRSDRIRALTPISYFPPANPRLQNQYGGKHVNRDAGWLNSKSLNKPPRHEYPL